MAPPVDASSARAADQEAAAKQWLMLAEAEEWDTISAPPGVYRFEQREGRGADPRRTPEYRQQVLEGLGLTDTARFFPHLSAEDLGAAREVLARCAGGLWLAYPSSPTQVWHRRRFIQNL